MKILPLSQTVCLSKTYSRLSLSLSLALGLAGAGSVRAQVESFDVVSTLTPPATDAGITPSGWVGALRSVPLGSSGIFVGNSAVFTAFEGTGYLAMNFQNSGSPGTISTWVISPVINLNNGDLFSFYTRTVANTFPDRLEVRMSTAGASVDVGNTENSVGDFQTLFITINPLLDGNYPEIWTQFSGNISGLGGVTAGRLAFRYTVSDAGPTGANSDYIGIDAFAYTVVPEAAPSLTVLAGLFGLVLRRRWAAGRCQ